MPEVDIEITRGYLRVVSIPATIATVPIVAGRARLVGWSFRETTGAAGASFDFTSGGNLIASGAMASGLDDTHFLGSIGVPASSDIKLVMVTGSIQGAVYVIIDD